uniref:Uncharacterized protein n=1 Tax=Helianthus annuus TaxID=4232 RepID=A0A251T623_HELAN
METMSLLRKLFGSLGFFFVKLILVGGGRDLKSFPLMKFVTISTFLRNPSL